MKSTRSKLRGTPEAAGYGFVLGVVVGTALGGSLLHIASAALSGAVLLPVLRSRFPLRDLAHFWMSKARAIWRAADISPS